MVKYMATELCVWTDRQADGVPPAGRSCL